jgi:Protein of unknown function (DUF1559)
LALPFYESANKALPPAAVTDKDGKPLLSWRVLILPYIEQDSLFREFHLDEPWDSPHNVKLIDRMPKTYEPFRGKKSNPPNTTHYRVFIGNNTPWSQKTTLEDITARRGTANTIMAIEAEEPVIWTKPDELEIGPDKPFPKLGLTPDLVLVAMFDGSVQSFPKPLDETEIRKLIPLWDE